MVAESTMYMPTHYRFSVHDYERMGMCGIIDEDERVELISGEIIQMSPVGDKHVRCINRFTHRLVLALDRLACEASAVCTGRDPGGLDCRSRW